MTALPLLLLLYGAAEWGPTVNGLRMSLEVGQGYATVTFENVDPKREMFLALGRAVGVGAAEFVRLNRISASGRQRLTFTGGNGLAPGRLVPFIVPLLPGSRYSWKTPLQDWRSGADLKPVAGQPGKLEASLAVDQAIEMQSIACFGLRIFWTGEIRSNVASMGAPSN